MSNPASRLSCSVDVEEPTSSGAVFHIDCNSDVKQEPEYCVDYEYHEDPLAIKEEQRQDNTAQLLRVFVVCVGNLLFILIVLFTLPT